MQMIINDRGCRLEAKKARKGKVGGDGSNQRVVHRRVVVFETFGGKIGLTRVLFFLSLSFLGCTESLFAEDRGGVRRGSAGAEAGAG
jgi:hypothetical protein